jgi:hypothetical protein
LLSASSVRETVAESCGAGEANLKLDALPNRHWTLDLDREAQDRRITRERIF